MRLLTFVGGTACLAAAAVSAQPIVGDFSDSPGVGLIGTETSATAGITWPAGDYTADTIVYYQLRQGSPENKMEDLKLVALGSFNAAESTSSSSSAAVALVSEVTVDFTVEGTRIRYYNLFLSFDEDMSTWTTNHFKTMQYQEELTVLPPLVCILVAVASKNVIFALASGVYAATFIIYDYNIVVAFLRMMDTYIVPALADSSHAYIIIFSWFLSGMVAGILRSGGGHGLATAVGKYARSPVTGGLCIFVLGLLIFFDDYANSLIVGQTMRPISDALLISREKLAFLVDATSAPVASISPISSWIGFELSLINDIVDSLSADGQDMTCYDNSAFLIFIQTIPTRFYPFAMLCLQFTLIVTNREFGPMLKAERRARGGKVYGDHADIAQVEMDPGLEPKEDMPKLWWNAAIPILVTIVGVLLSLVLTGVAGCHADDIPVNLQNVFSYSDSFGALLWASFIGSFTIWFLSWVQQVTPDGRLTHCFNKMARPIMTWGESIEVWIIGIKNLMASIVILLLAWAIGAAFTACGTGAYIASGLTGNINPDALPVLAFILSGLLSWITGTSWGTMAIMFPLVVPAAHLSAPCSKRIFYGTISAILAGSVFGDHCSPISDTTVLSAMSSRCDLKDHVATQTPYALFVGFVCVIMGSLATGYGAYPGWCGLLLSIGVTCGLALLLTVPIESNRLDIFNKMGAACPGRKNHVSDDKNEGYTAKPYGEDAVLAEEYRGNAY